MTAEVKVLQQQNVVYVHFMCIFTLLTVQMELWTTPLRLYFYIDR